MKKKEKKNIKNTKKQVQHLSDVKLEKLLVALAKRYSNSSLESGVQHYFKIGGSI